jgi:glycosyltransferase involved in cell wall biosynthesis
MLPKVSVFLLTYQQAHFINETIESVLSQDYPNLEIVVGDDGSTDGTQEILKQYDEMHPGLFKLLLSPSNEGITSNSNKVLAQCSGEFIALLGGDDLWLPGKLHKQVEWFLRNPDAALCHTKTDIFLSSTGETISLVPKTNAYNNDPANLGAFLKDIPDYVGSSFMLPRWAVPETGFDERVKWVSDWIFLIDILAKGRMGYIDEVLTRYRRHSSNISDNRCLMLSDLLLSCDIVENKYPEHTQYVKRYRLDLLENYIASKGLRDDFFLKMQNVLYSCSKFLFRRKAMIPIRSGE